MIGPVEDQRSPVVSTGLLLIQAYDTEESAATNPLVSSTAIPKTILAISSRALSFSSAGAGALPESHTGMPAE